MAKVRKNRKQNEFRQNDGEKKRKEIKEILNAKYRIHNYSTLYMRRLESISSPFISRKCLYLMSISFPFLDRIRIVWNVSLPAIAFKFDSTFDIAFAIGEWRCFFYLLCSIQSIFILSFGRLVDFKQFLTSISTYSFPLRIESCKMQKNEIKFRFNCQILCPSNSKIANRSIRFFLSVFIYLKKIELWINFIESFTQFNHFFFVILFRTFCFTFFSSIGKFVMIKFHIVSSLCAGLAALAP